MFRLCTTATLAEAHLLRDLLLRAGVDARVFNEHAQGGLGDIPFTHAWPEIWLDRPGDADRARALIDAFEHAQSGPDRGCEVCGEISPGSFEVCWHCGHTL